MTDDITQEIDVTQAWSKQIGRVEAVDFETAEITVGTYDAISVKGWVVSLYVHPPGEVTGGVNPGAWLNADQARQLAVYLLEASNDIRDKQQGVAL